MANEQNTQGDVDLKLVWEKLQRELPYLCEVTPFKTDTVLSYYSSWFGDIAPVRSIIELGVYRCGSLILWSETYGCHVVGLDLDPPAETMPVFDRYVAERNVAEKLRCFWRTRQDDAAILNGIVDTFPDQQVDVVVDDASHLYGPSRGSFDILFSRLRPGGIYIIEDWAAGARPDFQSGDGPLDGLIKDAINWFRDGVHAIERIVVTPGTTAIFKAHWPAQKLDPYATGVEGEEQLRKSLFERNVMIESLRAEVAERDNIIRHYQATLRST